MTFITFILKCDQKAKPHAQWRQSGHKGGVAHVANKFGAGQNNVANLCI